MGLEGTGDGFRVLGPGRVRGGVRRRAVGGVRGKGIRGRRRVVDAPDRGVVEWHRVEVFRG